MDPHQYIEELELILDTGRSAHGEGTARVTQIAFALRPATGYKSEKITGVEAAFKALYSPGRGPVHVEKLRNDVRIAIDGLRRSFTAIG